MAQGVLGVLVANLNLLVGTLALAPEWRALVVALVMAVLSPERPKAAIFRMDSARMSRSACQVCLVRGIVRRELWVLGSLRQKPLSALPSAWETVTVPSSPRSDHLRAQTSPRRMPVVSASSMDMPRGGGWAATASLTMRVRSSRLRAFIGVLTCLGGLQKSQGFLVMRS